MPIYFNEDVSIRCTYSNYNSGSIGRTYKTGNGCHLEAPLDVSAGIIRKIGQHRFEPGLHDDFTIMEDSFYSSYYVAARPTKAKSYSVIAMDLYTVNRKDDLTQPRRDAVLVRKEDASRIEVISGGGYAANGERRYDNIIIRARRGAIIVVQRRRDDHFRIGDQFFRISGSGVHKAYYGLQDMTPIGKFSEDIANDWLYI